VRLPYCNLATAPLPAALRDTILPGREGAWDTRQVLSSRRLDAAGRLVFGSVGALRGSGRAIHRDWGRRALAKLFSTLGRVAFEHEWHGWIGMARDALPRPHALARNVASVSGYNGRGIGPGTVFGRELARLAAGQVGVEALALPVTGIAPMAAAARSVLRSGCRVAHAVGARG
jgi:glycine/D-amino acid oxidase-like deaminating enzyme